MMGVALLGSNPMNSIGRNGLESLRQHLIVAEYYNIHFQLILYLYLAIIYQCLLSAKYQVLDICYTCSAPKLLNCSI